MPMKKSLPSLEKLSLEIIKENLNILQHAAKDLPSLLIDDLHEISVEDYNSTKKIGHLDYYDRPADEIIKKVSQHCKNLRSVCLSGPIDCLQAIISNNLHLVDINLCGIECTDDHLAMIAKHCPQLRHLDVFLCNSISDGGVNHLSERLVTLHLPDTISIDGRLKVLERIPNLKSFKNYPSIWHEMIEALSQKCDNRQCKRTYEIVEMELNPDLPISDNFLHDLGSLFPKLRSLKFYGGHPSGKRVGVILEAISHNLLTHLELMVSSDFIQIAAHLCPMLQELKIQVSESIEIDTIDNRYLAKPQHVPFEHLRKLRVLNFESALRENDFKLLLANCHHLNDLDLTMYYDLTDEVIYNILSTNPLKCLERLYLGLCEPFSGEALCEMLRSLKLLKRLGILDCKHLTVEDKVKVETLIEKMKWDLYFDWFQRVEELDE